MVLVSQSDGYGFDSWRPRSPGYIAIVIGRLKQWSSCLPTVSTVYLYLTAVYKWSADRGASIRGGIMSEWVVHMPWPLHYGHNMSRSVTMYSIAHRCWVAWEKDDRTRRASLCIGIIRNCWPFVHRQLYKVFTSKQTNKQTSRTV